jgi:hypothetical protein
MKAEFKDNGNNRFLSLEAAETIPATTPTNNITSVAHDVGFDFHGSSFGTRLQQT